jgi:hypothetical protein
MGKEAVLTLTGGTIENRERCQDRWPLNQGLPEYKAELLLTRSRRCLCLCLCLCLLIGDSYVPIICVLQLYSMWTFVSFICYL